MQLASNLFIVSIHCHFESVAWVSLSLLTRLLWIAQSCGFPQKWSVKAQVSLTASMRVPGLQSNGWAPTESGSSLAGSGASAAASWHQAPPQQPATISKPASEDSLDLQALVKEAVNHPQRHRHNALPNGRQSGTPSVSVTASLASAGAATHVSDAAASPEADVHLGVHSTGMYAEPAAVQAWATDGAASSILEQDSASSSHAPHYPARRSHHPTAHHINGYASGFSEGDLPGAKPGGVYADYAASSGSGHHWRDPTPDFPPGLYQSIAPHGSVGAGLAPATRHTSAARDQAHLPHVGPPSYALPTYAKHFHGQQGGMHPQPQVAPHLGWPQSRQPAGGVSARRTSSLQSLDLANDSWQERRSGQSQHSYGQRGKGGRPAAQNGGSATQPSSARVSPDRSRDSHRMVAPQKQGSATASAAQRPFTAMGFRHAEYPHASVADSFAESGLQSSSALQRQSSAFHARGAAKLPREAAEVAMPASATMADSHRPVLADWQMPAPVQSRDLAAATDIERLLQQLTPVMPCGSQTTNGLTLVRSPTTVLPCAISFNHHLRSVQVEAAAAAVCFLFHVQSIIRNCRLSLCHCKSCWALHTRAVHLVFLHHCVPSADTNPTPEHSSCAVGNSSQRCIEYQSIGTVINDSCTDDFRDTCGSGTLSPACMALRLSL